MGAGNIIKRLARRMNAGSWLVLAIAVGYLVAWGLMTGLGPGAVLGMFDPGERGVAAAGAQQSGKVGRLDRRQPADAGGSGHNGRGALRIPQDADANAIGLRDRG
jgi:hypothetical protein